MPGRRIVIAAGPVVAPIAPVRSQVTVDGHAQPVPGAHGAMARVPAHLYGMSNSPAGMPPGSPIAFPLAVITVSERGTMNVNCNGRDFPPPTTDASWSRAGFGDLLGAISEHRTHTARVEVHEFDGSVFTDIVHAARREQPIADVQSPSTMRRARHRPTNQLIEITGAGFVPGEDVTVALSVSSTEGSADGSARAVIDVSQLMDHQAEILLIGRVSGVIITEPSPS